MTRIVRLSVGVVFAVFVATGCAATGPNAPQHPSARGATPHFPVVVENPVVQDRNLRSPNLGQLRGSGVMLLSPTRVVFGTGGSSSCPWWPNRLTVLGPSSINIDMRVRNSGACFADLVAFPIAVKIDPRIVDVHHPLKVRLSYQQHYCCGEGTKRWHRTAVAPALTRS